MAAEENVPTGSCEEPEDLPGQITLPGAGVSNQLTPDANGKLSAATTTTTTTQVQPRSLDDKEELSCPDTGDLSSSDSVETRPAAAPHLRGRGGERLPCARRGPLFGIRVARMNKKDVPLLGGNVSLLVAERSPDGSHCL